MFLFPTVAVFAFERDHAFIRRNVKDRCHGFSLPILMDQYLLQNYWGDKAHRSIAVQVFKPFNTFKWLMRNPFGLPVRAIISEMITFQCPDRYLKPGLIRRSFP